MGMSADLSTVFSGANRPFIAELYERYLADPGPVDPSWRQFFAGLADDAAIVLKDVEGASWGPRRSQIIGRNGGPDGGVTAKANGGNGAAAAADHAVGTVGLAEVRAATMDSIRALMLIRAYRVRGHLEANLD